jgi:hypothetical protein
VRSSVLKGVLRMTIYYHDGTVRGEVEGSTFSRTCYMNSVAEGFKLVDIAPTDGSAHITAFIRK